MSSKLIDAFLDALWLERGASVHTLDAYRRDLMHWQRHLSRHDMSLLAPDSRTYQMLIDERRHNGYQARSDARLTSSLRRFYRWALVTGQIDRDGRYRGTPGARRTAGHA